MSQDSTEHHLEHAEHVPHAALNPFDRQVAMTMAMVAAVLACVSMLSHRAHNDTLKLRILANDDLTEASNRWGHYQAKKNRAYMYAADALLLGVMAKDTSKPDAATQAGELIAEWERKASVWTNDYETIEHEARELGHKAKEEDDEGSDS